MNHRCEVEPDQLGPYLLGHLEPESAHRVAQQIARCPLCSRHVDELAPVVDAMARSAVPDDDETLAVDATALAAGWAFVSSAIQRDRRLERIAGRRRLWAVAAAVVVAIGLGLGVVALTQIGDTADGQRISLSGTSSGVDASAILDDRPTGTSIDLEVSGLDPQEIYGVWIERKEGGRLSAGSFRPSPDGTAHVSLSGALPLSESRAVGVALLPGGSVTAAVDVLSATLP